MTSVLIEVDHFTRYRYAAPVELAQHLACLRPLEDDAQQVAMFDMAVAPAPAHHHGERDAWGNSRTFFSTTQPHESLSVHASSRVRVSARVPALDLARTPAWEAVAARLRYTRGARYEAAAEFAQPSPHVPRLEALRALGAPCFAPGTPVAVGAIDLMRAVHAGFEYRSASTAVDTPLAQVLAQRRGVCQDFAHAMIGALRMLGLAARYVSGYLLTAAPAGHAPILGADASHAWVEVWCPGLYAGAGGDWLALDPTNDLLPAEGHVRLAVGRDYTDVAPLRGVIRGGGGHHALEVQVRTRVLASEGPGSC
jgi:transglutaminase-like putative cysteine protease